MQKISILDIKISNVILTDVLKTIDVFINSTKTNYITTPNPEIILAAQKNNVLKKIINEADLALPDGVGLIFASLFRIKHRITGTDIMEEIMKKYPQKKYKFIINEMGLTTKTDLNKLSINFHETEPDIIFIGLGSPKQEQWIAENKNKYPTAKIIMTVGGGIDFLTGRQKRAPLFLRKIGLEWLWRLIKQPSRFGRIINATIIFPFKVIFNF